MNGTKFCLQPMKLANAIARSLSAFALTFVCFTSSSVPVQAKIAKPVAPTTTPVNRSNLLKVKFVPPPVPYQDAPKGRRRGGASRCPDCKNINLPLTALVPGDNSKSFLALTSTEYPTFWFYVPYALTPEHSVEFVLQDAADNYIYKTTFTAPGTPVGVVSIPLPADGAPLEIGKRYHWTFLIQDPSNFVFVQGFVQQVTQNSTLTSQLKAATPQERIALYAANGIWHETLTTLAELRRMNPEDARLAADWVNLLQSVGLDNIATEPIVQCCTLKPHSASSVETKMFLGNHRHSEVRVQDIDTWTLSQATL